MRQQKYRNPCKPPFLMLKAVQSSAKREMALELYSDPQETRGLSLCVMRIENKAPLSLPLSLPLFLLSFRDSIADGGINKPMTD